MHENKNQVIPKLIDNGIKNKDTKKQTKQNIHTSQSLFGCSSTEIKAKKKNVPVQPKIENKTRIPIYLFLNHLRRKTNQEAS